VVGYVALFLFVLGGTAIALPGRNKVDTGDIKKNAVRTSDIAPRAVTAAKIAPRSVDGLRVIDHSLTAEDIDESTLNIRPAPGSIGPTELADRPRRLVFGPGELLISEGSSIKVGSVGTFPALLFPNVPANASLATDVPGSRVEGTKMTLRLVWSASLDGSVVWNVGYTVAGSGGDLQPVAATETQLETPATGGTLTTTSFEIPAEKVSDGDLLGVAIERSANSVHDTLPTDARLHLIEIDYTANG
jgi:hypothetical protein